MIRASSLKPHDPVYTWISDCGKNIHIHSGRLFEWCERNKPRAVLVAVDHELGQSFLKRNVVDPLRCLQLALECEAGERKLSPVIFAKMNLNELKRRNIEFTSKVPDALLVDGHHRYAMMAMMQQSLIPAYVLPMHIWTKFQVIIDDPRFAGLDVTQEALESFPITERDY